MRHGDTGRILVKLIENDYRRLRKFKGESSLRTYVTIVVQRLFLDYRNEQWGKWRPSARGKKLGATAEILEALTYRDGHSFEEAFQLMRLKRKLEVTRDRLWALFCELRPRVSRRFLGEEQMSDAASVTSRSDHVEDNEIAERLQRALAETLSELTEQECLVLKMRLWDGFTAEEIGAALGMDRRAVYNRFERTAKKLRRALESRGWTRQQVGEILARRKVDFEIDDVRPEVARPAPVPTPVPA